MNKDQDGKSQADNRQHADDERVKEAQRTLDRVSTESETIGTSSLVRMANKASAHMVADDAQGEDQAEIWGRRVGRGLSVIAFIVLAIWLFNWLTR